MTAALLADTPWITAHAARIRVTSISMGSGSLAQFEAEPMLEAARLLAEANVGSIRWNGTAAGWLGHARDRGMTAAITAATGVPATSALLATLDALALLGADGIGLVTPYVDAVQERVRDNFAGAGIPCIADRRLDITDNFAFAEVTEATLERM